MLIYEAQAEKNLKHASNGLSTVYIYITVSTYLYTEFTNFILNSTILSAIQIHKLKKYLADIITQHSPQSHTEKD